MQLSQALGLTAVSTLILAAAGLVISLQVTNPLLDGHDVATAAIVTLGVVTLAVAVAVGVGLPRRRSRTPYW